MKKIRIGKAGPEVPAVAVGCMRLGELDDKAAESFVKSALDMGANFFEHADIYGGGSCESIFAKAIGMNPQVREKVILQSKCGIVPGKYYDFSKKHILEAVNGILQRLKTDYLDFLLLHRPDILVEPEEVAEAFSILHNSGKVRYFGVSNEKPSQIELLKKYVSQPLVANQLQLSILCSGMLSQGIHVNMADAASVERDGSVLDYCRLNDITIQCWSPFQYGFFEGVFLDNPKFPELNKKIDEIAKKYGVSNTTIAVAWLLRHPAHFQVIAGTMKTKRLADCIAAEQVDLTRAEWYEIYLAAGNTLP
ncbi:MAG: aldo/keto reductase [Spirochaetaceae bacterium]|jgi:predicted oxidoreductase|nr:aldo/keto reductase [Spirochaetaceae bacterium]